MSGPVPARFDRLVGVFGFGNVGRALCDQVQRIGCSVGFVADSSACVHANGQALTAAQMSHLSAAKAAGKPLEQALEGQQGLAATRDAAECIRMMGSVGKPAVVCDTSANATAFDDYLRSALDAKVPVALANKKPLSGDLEHFHLLRDQGLEATVGAGLPVICTLNRMIESGDVVTRIEGQLSGTLGYILSALEEGGKFSDIVREAKAQGFTEPDPRDDLSGTDVARKALILSRVIGGSLNLEDVKVEALFPESFASLSLEEFMDRLPELDDGIQAKVDEAAAKAKVLRYAAVVEPGQPLSVGLVQVDGSSPLAGLKGTDNLVSISSEWYNSSPTVVRGPGAGVEVTAAGVLADAINVTRGASL